MDKVSEMDLLSYFEVIKRRIKFILIITLSFSLISGIFSYFILKPTYKAETTIIIGKDNSSDAKNNQQTYNDVMMFQNLIKTYSQIAQSYSVAQLASQEVGGIATPEQLQGQTSVTPQTGTQIMQITVTDLSPELAAQKVNAVADAFTQEAKRLLPTGSVNIMDKAKTPTGPVSPNKKLNIMIAFLLGLMVSLGIVFLIESMDKTIKTEKDIEKYLELPIIGTIPKHSVE